MKQPDIHKSQGIVLKYAPLRLAGYVLLLLAFVWFSMLPFFLYEYPYAWYLYWGIMSYLSVFISLNIFIYRFKAIEVVPNGIIVYGKFRNPLHLEWEDIEDIGATKPASLNGLQRVIVEIEIKSDKKYLSRVNVLYRFWVWLHLMERDGFSISTYLMRETAEEVVQLLEKARSNYFKQKLESPPTRNQNPTKIL
jgi:hypothetical protein